MRRVRRRGYLLVVVAICVSIFGLSYLRLAASAAASDDRAENDAARVVARYAAESGLVVACQKLQGRPTGPSVGTWFTEDLTGAKIRVSVLKVGNKRWTVSSAGTAKGEAGLLVTRNLQADLVVDKAKNWKVVQCEELLAR